MNFLLIISKKDPASVNFWKTIDENYNLDKIEENNDLNNNLYKIKFKKNKQNSKNLIESDYNNIYLKIINNLHINTNEKELLNFNKNKDKNKDKIKIEIDQIIFLSKHSTNSDHKPRSITVHAIGNYSKAELGGKDYTLVKTDPILIRLLLLNLKENKKKDLNYSDIKKFEVKQEATHHGPYIDISSIFYEIGSCKDAWNNKKVSKYMIDILINTLKNYNKEDIINKKYWIECAGVGGSHYCTKFNKFTFNNNNKYCFGHIVPSYALEDFKNKKKDFIDQIKENNKNTKILKENLEEY